MNREYFYRLGIIILYFSLFHLSSKPVYACTTAVISGSYTADGRPLLIKHRDSGFEHNRLVYFTDGDYDYIGLVNSGDSSNSEVWAGTNSAGFCIINSASYNLKGNDDTTRLKDREGVIMKLALMSCKTIYDFEALLDTLPKPLGVEANFGVIDADGGAAYFETDNFSYEKWDANDPSTAPFGYIIRTNYSFGKNINDGYGYIRYLTAEQLLYNAVGANELNYKFLLQKVSRSLKHSLTGKDLLDEYSNEKLNTAAYEFFRDYIPRYTSCASTVFHGVAPGEAPGLTTMWTVLGFPLSSIAVPVWINDDASLPAALTAGEDNKSLICDMSLNLKERLFPIKRGSGYKYINISALVNGDNNGILQRLLPIENEIIRNAEDLIGAWRSSGINRSQLIEFYDWIDNYIMSKFSNEFM